MASTGFFFLTLFFLPFRVVVVKGLPVELSHDPSSGMLRSSVPITVHICPSTHMDPGWFQTVDQLYDELFKYTITNVTAMLQANPQRTYAPEITVIWAMYVGEEGPEVLRELISNGQMEFVGGGWVQPDEAITRFEDLIDQQALGHLYLQSVLGHNPVRVGWQADPFGHSNTFAYIGALNAYDAHVLGRPMSPYDPINSNLNTIWHPMSSFPDSGGFNASSSVMTFNTLGYWEPYRSMVDMLAKDKPLEAAAVLSGYLLTNLLNRPPNVTNLLVMFGDDAPLQQPYEVIFPALDSVIALLNNNTTITNITYKYSTPSAWVKALAEEVDAHEGPDFPSRPSWDMLPLVGNEFPYWVGYYTSRSEFKELYHQGSSFFRASSMVHALASDERTWFGGAEALLTLWSALGLVQHHDIITGDCYDQVAEDNGMRVRTGVSNAGSVASSAAALLLSYDGPDMGLACFNYSQTPCPSIVAGLESRTPVVLSVFNPLSWTQTNEPISLIVPSDTVVVRDASSGTILPSQMAPYYAPDLPPTTNWSSLVFLAPRLSPLGLATFILTAKAAQEDVYHAAHIAPPLGSSLQLSNGLITATFTPNGTLASLQSGSASLSVVAKMLYYTSPGGEENAWDFSSAGSTEAFEFPGVSGQSIAWTVLNGSLFSELAVTIDAENGVMLRYRLYPNETFLHVYVSSGPFVSASNSTDAIFRLETNVANSKGQFWTDANGLELLPRTRWSRPFTSINYTDQAGPEPVAINMYPVTAYTVLADADDPSQPCLLFLTANSHAATSMSDGVVEWTMNRNVVNKEGQRFTGNRLVTQHVLLGVASSLPQAAAMARPRSVSLSNPPLLMATADASIIPPVYPFTPLLNDFPPQLTILSLQLLPNGFNLSSLFLGGQPADNPSSSGSLMLRIRHIYQAGMDDPGLAVPISVDLSLLLAPHWNISGVVEFAVDGSQPMDIARQAQVMWPEAPTPITPPPREYGAFNDVHGGLPREQQTTVTLCPMQIKTYLLQLA